MNQSISIDGTITHPRFGKSNERRMIGFIATYLTLIIVAPICGITVFNAWMATLGY